MIFVWILLVIILLIVALDQLIERMYHYERKLHHITPGKYNLPFDEIRIPAAKGGQLYAWWIPAAPEAPTLVLVHGWGRNLARMMPYIRALHPLGYNLLAFDARNHGSSSPVKRPTVSTFSEDVLSAVDFLTASGLTSSDDIGVIGLSIGGGAAINAAAWNQRLRAVITVGALSHPIEVMKLEFQKRNIPDFIPWLLFGYMRLRFGLNFDKIAPVNNIKNVNADILLIHGREDETIPLAQGQALDAAATAGKTHLWIVPGKGHSNCNTHPQFWERVGAFLESALPLRDTQAELPTVSGKWVQAPIQPKP